MKKDIYLKRFVNYCRKRFDNLIAVVIFGSYAWNYFDKKKSDYDVFVIFKEKVPKGKTKLKKKFKKIALHGFCADRNLIKKTKEGHWTTYVTLLKGAKILYQTKGYKKFLRELNKVDPLEKVSISMIKRKLEFEKNALKKKTGFDAAKWALPSIRKRLQFLVYIKKNQKLWSLNKVLAKNKDVLVNKEIIFLKELDKKVRKRSQSFSREDKKTAFEILDKVGKELISRIN